MKVLGSFLLVLSILLLAACQENQLTGSGINSRSCLELGKGLYDNAKCNLNCKTSERCQAVIASGRTCYQCNDKMAVTQYVSCWNGSILTQLDMNKTQFLLNQTNSGLQTFCMDDCSQGMVCNAACKCAKAPPPKSTCTTFKHKTNGQHMCLVYHSN